MTIYIVRHAKAGKRSEWHDDDNLRPLSPTGWKQAELVAERLKDLSITSLISSPAITKYTRIGMNVGTPSVRTSLTTDIYLTLEPPVRQDANEARIKVFIKPMIIWLWIGTALMAVGTVLAAFPGRRRKPTDATSAPVEVAAS
ncbi:MAG: cytochrome c-type biogenesis CcmF C-terminal domain-containing protein [Acidimicrobiaceae bacterium]